MNWFYYSDRRVWGSAPSRLQNCKVSNFASLYCLGGCTRWDRKVSSWSSLGDLFPLKSSVSFYWAGRRVYPPNWFRLFNYITTGTYWLDFLEHIRYNLYQVYLNPSGYVGFDRERELGISYWLLSAHRWSLGV